MQISKTLYVKNRDQWRKWLEKNYKKEKDIWLIYYKKHTGKPRISYDDAVEEALCFGWIDSTVKRVDDERTAQRFSPRRKTSNLSELNRQRVKKMIAAGKMTEAGLEILQGKLDDDFKIPKDILADIKKNDKAWENFQNFPDYYKMVRIAFIEGARKRPEEFKKRLNYFIKMTSQNKRFGMMK